MKKLIKFTTIGILSTFIIFPFTAEKTSIEVHAQEIMPISTEFNCTAGVIKAINETIVCEDAETLSLARNIVDVTGSPLLSEEEVLEIKLSESVETGLMYTYEDIDKTMYAKTSVNVRTLPNTESEKLGGLDFAEEIHVIGKCNETGWYKIEYNDTIGHVSDNYLTDTKPEPPKQSKPKNYNPPSGGSGQDVVNYAVQFVGNPYVWGGTSLTNGTDCSGFVQSVYAAFGVSLPRTSYSQRSAGYAVSESEMQPGDIVCYSGHVGIYIGNGQIVHASNAKEGIKISNYNYRTVVAVRRIY